MKTLIDALKSDLDFRLTYGNKWLVWNHGEWVVYQRKKNAKNTVEVARTMHEHDAIITLKYH